MSFPLSAAAVPLVSLSILLSACSAAGGSVAPQTQASGSGVNPAVSAADGTNKIMTTGVLSLQRYGQGGLSLGSLK